MFVKQNFALKMVLQNFSFCAAYIISSQARWTCSALSLMRITFLGTLLVVLEVVSINGCTRSHFKTQRLLSVLHAFTIFPLLPSKGHSLISIVTPFLS